MAIAPDAYVHRRGEEERVRLYVEMHATETVLADTAGTHREMPLRTSGQLDHSGVRQVLQERRRLEPNRRQLTIVLRGEVSAEDLLFVLDAARMEGYEPALNDQWL